MDEEKEKVNVTDFSSKGHHQVKEFPCLKKLVGALSCLKQSIIKPYTELV